MGNVVASFLDPSINNFLSPFLLCLIGVNVVNRNYNLDVLRNALEDLQAKRDDLLLRIDAEEREGGKRLATVVRWLSKVQTIETKTSMLLAEASTLRRNFFRDISSANKVPKMLRDIKKLKFDGVLLALAGLAPLDYLAPSLDEAIAPSFTEELYELKKYLVALEMELQALSAMRNELFKMVSKEEGRGMQVLREVKGWISVVDDLELEANHLLDRSISEVHKLSKCDNISSEGYKKEVFFMLKKFKSLKLKGVFEAVIDRALPRLVTKRPPIQLTVSQEKLLDMAWDCLKDENVGTLCFYGMGGVGKTTLLSQIKDKLLEAGNAFGLEVFTVLVPEEVESIQDEIARSIGISGSSEYWIRGTHEEKAFRIYNVLNGMRFLLLLDDLQKEVDLEEIGVPLPTKENGCKIIFTASSREACDNKWVDVVEEVKSLSQDESWDLFQKTVGETTLKSHPDIPQLARLVARKCGGLPFALSLIGETMSHKRTANEWHHAVHAMVLSTAQFLDMENTYFPILKYTYDILPGERMRLCILYCALFPKDCYIKKNNLVDYWIGEGIIATEDRETAKVQGCDMIGDLVRTRLLMEDESGHCVKMQGIVRELALWIASDFGKDEENFVVTAGERIQKMPEVKNWRSVIRMSVTSTQIETISGSPRCSELTTLFLQENNLKWISGEFFRWMTSLVVLNLSRNNELAELPEEISFLASLQFLNLSWTMIKRLPLGLKKLRRLIHLDLEHTLELEAIEVIPSLLNLQVLRLFKSVPVELSVIKDIQLLESLTELTLTVTQHSVLEWLLGNHRLASCTRRVSIRDIPKVTTDWRSKVSVISRERETVLFGNIEDIPRFRHLSKVSLDTCDYLIDLTWLILAPCLKDLSLTECSDMKHIISEEKANNRMGHRSEQPFQNLTRLSLNDLPELESIYWTPLPFPALQYLEIRGCPKLTRLPFNSESAKGNLVQVELDFFVLTRVKWEDQATKRRFCNLN